MWRENPNEKYEPSKKYYRQCGAYTICKMPPKYILTSRAGDEIIIHCVRDSFNECTEYYEKQIRNKATSADADISDNRAAD